MRLLIIITLLIPLAISAQSIPANGLFATPSEQLDTLYVETDMVAMMTEVWEISKDTAKPLIVSVPDVQPYIRITTTRRKRL